MSVLDLSEASATTSVGPAPVTQPLPVDLGTGPEQAHTNSPRLLPPPPRNDRLAQVLRALSGNMDAEEPVVVGDSQSRDAIQERFARSGLSFGR